MAGIALDGVDRGGNRHIIAHDAHHSRSRLQHAPERPFRLIADEKHAGAPIRQPVAQMVPDAARITHAAGRNDDVEALEARQRL